MANFYDDNTDQATPMTTGQSSSYSGKKSSGRQGFASMASDQQRKIASKGGKAAHRKGTAHEWTSEEARAAGRKGGQR